jgi:hypothetical protein
MLLRRYPRADHISGNHYVGTLADCIVPMRILNPVVEPIVKSIREVVHLQHSARTGVYQAPMMNRFALWCD